MLRALIVELGTYRNAPTLRDAIGAAGPGLDQTLFAEAVKDGQIAVGQHHPVACEAGDGGDFGAIAPFMENAATKGQNVQNTLFGS